MLAAAGAIYGAIKTDLRHAAESAELAHRRIDEHLTAHAARGRS